MGAEFQASKSSPAKSTSQKTDVNYGDLSLKDVWNAFTSGSKETGRAVINFVTGNFSKEDAISTASVALAGVMPMNPSEVPAMMEKAEAVVAYLPAVAAGAELIRERLTGSHPNLGLASPGSLTRPIQATATQPAPATIGPRTGGSTAQPRALAECDTPEERARVQEMLDRARKGKDTFDTRSSAAKGESATWRPHGRSAPGNLPTGAGSPKN